MFYAHFVLSKKGPLARIWLAAHWDKKLTKAHVFETDINSSVEAIIQPKVKLALRTSGHLLLGVVRIYSRKAKYLLADCNEAFVKIKMAFRPGVVDLPEENREAAVAAITLPETFHDFESTMADLTDIDVQAQFTVNQSRPEEITMREDLGNITLAGDDGFGDMGFDQNMIQDVHMDDTLYVKNPDSALDVMGDTDLGKEPVEKPMDIDIGPPREDGFDGGMADFGENFVGEGGGLFEEPLAVPEIQPQPEEPPKTDEQNKDGVPEETVANHTGHTTTAIPDQTTLIPNEAEAFALEPIDITSIGTERKSKRKRKLVIDEQKGIPSEQMKLQLSDTSDIVTTLDLAPPTKKLMHWKETGGVEKLFALPGRPMVSRRVSELFNKNLVTESRKEVEEERLDLEEHRQEYQEEEPEIARETEDSRPAIDDPFTSHIEPPSLVEEPSRVEPSLAETSSMSRQPEEDTTLQPELPVIPDDVSGLGLGDGIPSRRSSSEEEVEDLIEPDDDDIFDEAAPEPEQEEEEAADAEEEEERRWGKRSQQMLHIIERVLLRQDSASFKELVLRNNRKQVASKFHTILVLKKLQAIEVEQNDPFGDIICTRGPKFTTVY